MFSDIKPELWDFLKKPFLATFAFILTTEVTGNEGVHAWPAVLKLEMLRLHGQHLKSLGHNKERPFENRNIICFTLATTVSCPFPGWALAAGQLLPGRGEHRAPPTSTSTCGLLLSALQLSVRPSEEPQGGSVPGHLWLVGFLPVSVPLPEFPGSSGVVADVATQEEEISNGILIHWVVWLEYLMCS